ncbi:hypothetical protein [Saccharothrix variisporea]|uniref:Lipoprotein n=1 Tax=Saccharothrix variisporea TaxID=543527 RepID=A0A495XIJ8_9PSEU|nr:hypothetical protein [Saccharothrix variisporea]RKT71428.1 hypothetical protein DFJ66_4717 [Saccharothrix variisporea]
MRALVVLAIGAVVVAGCTSAQPAPSTTTAAPARTVVVDDVPVLTPNGLGKVQLGMTLEELRATGEVGEQLDDWPQANCPVYGLKRAAGWVGINDGVAVDLRLEGGARTPEGLRFGESQQRVRELYPTATLNPHGYVLPLAESRWYYFGFANAGDTLTVMGVRTGGCFV